MDSLGPSEVMLLSSPIYKYQVMWTADVSKKHKTYNDGYLSFHKFNKLAILYNDQMNEVAKEFFSYKNYFEKDEEVRFERYMIEIEDQLETHYQDLSPLYDRPHHPTVIPANQQRNANTEMPANSPSSLTTPRRQALNRPLLNLGSPPTMLVNSPKKRLPMAMQGPSLGPKRIRHKVPETPRAQSRPLLPPSDVTFRRYKPLKKLPVPQSPSSTNIRVVENISEEYAERIVIEDDSQESAPSSASVIAEPPPDLDQEILNDIDFFSSDEDDIPGNPSAQIPTSAAAQTSKRKSLDAISLLDEELGIPESYESRPKLVSQSEDEIIEIASSAEFLDDLDIEPNSEPHRPADSSAVNEATPSTGNNTPLAQPTDDLPRKASSPPNFAFPPTSSLKGFSSRKPLLCLSKLPVNSGKRQSFELPKPSTSSVSAASKTHVSLNLFAHSDKKESPLTATDTQDASINVKAITIASSPVTTGIGSHSDVSPKQKREDSKGLSSPGFEEITELDKKDGHIIPDPSKIDSSPLICEDIHNKHEQSKEAVIAAQNEVGDMAADLEIELSQVMSDIALSQAENPINEENNSFEDEPEDIPKIIEKHETEPPVAVPQHATSTATLTTATEVPSRPLGAPPTKRRYPRNTTMPPSKHPQYTMPVFVNPANTSSTTRARRETSNFDVPAITPSSPICISSQGPWTEETLDLFSWRPKELNFEKT